jgi:arsenate reductase (thioredoxin)
MERKLRVLFFSTGNATRSQMAEGFLEELTNGDVAAESTAVKSVEVNPTAVEVMKEVGIDLAKHHAKPVASSLKEHFAFVVTMSDDAKERSPVWPFTRNLLHWSMPDPVADGAPAEQQAEMLRRVRDEIADRVNEFARKLSAQLRGQREPARAP